MNRQHTAAAAPGRPRPTAGAGPGPAHDHDDAFVALYHRLRSPLVRLATLLVDRGDIAEELVQEAFATTYRDWARLDEPAAFVRAALVNRCRSELRRRDTRRRRPLAGAPPAGASPAGEPNDHLRDVIARLPERQRTVVVLRFYADLPLHKIAALMDIRTGTVKSQLHRALAHLRKEIRP
jgi:RNA polymerase sigma-70 factor (sigma-E family)